MAIDTGIITTMPELTRINYSALDFDTVKNELINYIKTNYPDEQNDFLETNTGVMLLDIIAYITDILSYRADFLSNENYISTAQTKKSIIKLLELINYRLGRQAAASGDVLCTLVDAEVGLLNGLGKLTNNLIISPVNDRTILDTTDESGNALEYEVYKSTEDLQSNVILPSGIGIGGTVNAVVIQGKSTSDIFTASVNRDKNQRYPISVQNMLEDTLAVTVNGVTYTRVDNLAYENGATRTYVVEFDEDNYSEIVFGDDTFGAIPPAGAEIIGEYRYGGGKRGNLVKGGLSTSQAFIYNGYSFTVKFENSSAITGGSDEETIEHAKNFAPKSFKTQVREVTGEDYSVFASGYSDGTNGSIEKAVSSIRPYLSKYAGNSGPFRITSTTNKIKMTISGIDTIVTLTTGTDITVSQLISDFNEKINLLATPSYDPPIEMVVYASKHYRFLGTLPEQDTGYVIDNTNNIFKVNFNSIVYTVNIPLGNFSLAEIVTLLNASFATGGNNLLQLFRAETYIDAADGNSYLSIVATKNIDPTLVTFVLPTTIKSAYAQFGLVADADPSEYDAQCPAIATKYHTPELTLETVEVTNQVYDILNMTYSIANNGIGKAYPCSANYIDIYVLARGENNNLVTASTSLKNALKDFMDRFKQITDEIVIWDGALKVINMDVTVTITRGYKKETIETSINNFLDTFFDPSNNDFGLPMHISKIYEGIEAVTGVNNAIINDVEEDGISQLNTGNNQIRNVSVETNQIWTRGNVTITYTYSRV